MSNVVLYTGLASSNSIRRKLDEKGISFTEKSVSRPQMTFTKETVLCVDGKELDRKAATEWIHNNN